MAVIPALLVTHADLAAALLRAAEKICGPIEGVEVLSNEDLSREVLESEIARRVAAWTGGGLVLTDFWGGSPHTCATAAARAVIRKGTTGSPEGEVAIVTGVNLPVLLDYLYNRDRYGVLELAERLRKKGQDSFRVQRGEPA